jgi:hypothetical protein
MQIDSKEFKLKFISKQGGTIIVDPPRPPRPPKAPAWFRSFEERNNSRFDRIENRLDRLETDVAGVKTELANVIKLNNLKH